jgi:hypothetical protein
VLEVWATPSGPSGGITHVVRALYNQEPLDLPGCPPGTCLELDRFEELVLGRFVLSDAQHSEACVLRVSHESPLPRPKAMASAADLEDM